MGGIMVMFVMAAIAGMLILVPILRILAMRADLGGTSGSSHGRRNNKKFGR